MKNRVRRGTARLKRVYTEPWTVRNGWINTGVWTIATLVALGNLAFGLLMGGRFMPLWTVINVGLLFFDFTMLKWSVTGLMWRKAKAELEREESKITEAFYAMVIEEYKSRDRSN